MSPAHFSVTHANPAQHLQPSPIGDLVLDDGTLFADMRAAAEKVFAELHVRAELQERMLARLRDVNRGGAIFIHG